MDQQRFSLIAHTDLPFSNPINAAKWKQLVELLELPRDSRVLDLGCGKGEVLLQVAARYGAHGTGVDESPGALEIARKHAAERGLSGVTAFVEAPIAEFSAPQHSFDLVMNLGTIEVHGYRPMIERMRSLVKPNGLVLLGHRYWKKEPENAYLHELHTTRDELTTHAENIFAAGSLGLTCLYSAVASLDDWDEYEGRYNRAILRYVTAHPQDADAHAMRERAVDWYDTYLRWGRDTLGFGLYLFHTSSELLTHSRP